MSRFTPGSDAKWAVAAHERLEQKHKSTYTVKEIDNPEAVILWNSAIEAKSVAKRQQARGRAVDAWTTVTKNIDEYHLGVFKMKAKAQAAVIEKPSVLTRIYNWFLSIKLD